MMEHEELILICAVRYALGRQSYIVGDVAKYVASRCKTLSQECKNVIIFDIKESITFYHNYGTTCGMECDERTWKNFLKLLKGEEDV